MLPEFKKIGVAGKKKLFERLFYSLLEPEVKSITIPIDSKNADEVISKKIHENYDTIFNTLLVQFPCEHINAVRTKFRRIRRYDLLIKELRSEQKTSRSKFVNQHGSNLPSVLDILIPCPQGK